MRHASYALFLASLAVLSQCSSGVAPARCSNEGGTACFDNPEYVLTCSTSGTMTAQRCPEGNLCYQDHCQPLACVPKSKTCRGDAVVLCNDDGSAQLDPLSCPSGKTCSGGECKDKVCTPGSGRCAGPSSTERCNEAGSGWEPSSNCTGNTTCLEGACLSTTCTAGQTECGPNTVYSCGANNQWIGSPCPGGNPCFYGHCIQCVGTQGCAEGETCVEGLCKITLPKITTTDLLPATEGAAYSFKLQVQGGRQPYSFSVVNGTLPTGIQLSIAGELMGTATTAGLSNFTAKVVDANGASDQKQLTLQVGPKGPVKVATTSLPDAEAGMDYTYDLAATGGQAPFAWQLLAGALPKGLSLFSTGTLAGIPDEIGSFPVTVRVVDGLTPPGYDSKDLTLKVKIAPLQVVGDKEINLFVTKVIPLPTLIQYVPYSADLTAKGGLKPYQWSEQSAPGGMGLVIPKMGLPQGLTISPSGKISGIVTDTSTAITVKVPLSTMTLTGYFTYVQVSDSQNPAATATAVYLLPTVPLQ